MASRRSLSLNSVPLSLHLSDGGQVIIMAEGRYMFATCKQQGTETIAMSCRTGSANLNVSVCDYDTV